MPRIFLNITNGFAVVAILLASAQLMCFAANSKPNFIFIFSDDQAPDTVAAWGNPYVITPHLDKLSQAGSNFMNAYNAGAWRPAVCVPSRTMLNSGLTLWRSRVVDHEKGLQEVPFWSEVMRDAGYTTYMTGKWHLLASAEEAFDVVRNVRPGMPNIVPALNPEAYNRPIKGRDDLWHPADPELSGFWEGGKHWSEVLADDAEAFLQHAMESDSPFFMYLAFNAPHDPRQAPQEYLDKYPLETVEVPENFQSVYWYANHIGARHSLRDEFLAPMPRTHHAVRVHRQEYYAITSHMDTQIGRILAALERSGKADNTYVIFTSDHGLAVGRHGLMGKQNAYEHSLRVPFIITGPGIEAGLRIRERIYFQDVMPTVIELAGAEIPGHVEFRSLLPLLAGEGLPHYPAIYAAYIDYQRMVIEDDWKLIVYPKVPRLRLFNLIEDPLEMNDLIDDPSQTSRIRQLFNRLLQLQIEWEDPLDLSAIEEILP
jgi:arylsulfatase A-like enzyme